jgi:hypothetical protein
MSKRLNGTATKDAAYPRDPNGWYVETETSVRQLFELVDFGSDLIWDPSCGRGTILDVARRLGHATMGSDIVDRFKPGRHQFYVGDFLRIHGPPMLRHSIVCNPPYNEPSPMIAEAFVEKALTLGGWNRAAFLVPLEFQCGQTRYRKFWRDPATRPSHVISLCERPSMPPGQMLEDKGESCRGGGMADYCWIVWTAGGPFRTEHLFARPTDVVAHDNSTRRVRARRNAASASAT